MSLSKEALMKGWAHQVEKLDAATADQVERFVALPIEARRGAALDEQLQPTTTLIVSLISVATSWRQDEPDESYSLADIALLLIGRLSLAGEDCRRLVDTLIDYWLEVIESALLGDDLRWADSCLRLVRQLAQLAGDEPARAARIGMNQAQLHWQRAEIEASLTELEAALVYCEKAENPNQLAAALCYQGIALATAGRLAEARASLQRCLEVLPADHELYTTVAREALDRLDERL